MALTHKVILHGLTVSVRELSVREVREWAMKVEAGLVEVDPVLHLALDEPSAEDILVMSDAKAEDLEGLAPSELEEIMVVCRKLNPHFFRVRAALARTALAMQLVAQRVVSSEPAPP